MSFLTRINMDNFNRDNAVTLRDTIGANAAHFNIAEYFEERNGLRTAGILETYEDVSSFLHPCGNTACIAGFASLLHHKGGGALPTEDLSAYLGIDHESASHIASEEHPWLDVFGEDFFTDDKSWEGITAEDGVALIDAIIREYDRRIAA